MHPLPTSNRSGQMVDFYPAMLDYCKVAVFQLNPHLTRLTFQDIPKNPGRERERERDQQHLSSPKVFKWLVHNYNSR